MLGISPMVGIWGAPHAPNVRRCRYSGCRTQRKTQAIWGANPKPPISPMACIWENAQAPGCIWGAPHTSNVRRCRYSGSPNPTRDASCLGSQPQAPSISDGVYLGECPSPEVFMGSAPCPQDRTLPLFGVPNPFKDAGYLGSQPQAPNISDGMYLGECPSPRVYMGSTPCPRYNFSFFILHFSFFIIHFHLS